MHPLNRNITIDTHLSPSAGRGPCEEGVTFPWQTGSAMVVRCSALQERNDPRAALFWLLAPPELPTPIRHAASVSAEQEKVREILRANISTLALGDAYRPIVEEIASLPAYDSSNFERLTASFYFLLKTGCSTLVVPIGPENAPGSASPILKEESELLASQPQGDPLSLDWVQALLRDGRQNTSKESFLNMVNAVEDLLGHRNFAFLDELLTSIDYGEISPEGMVAFVRTTYQARSKLAAWPGAVQKIKDELTRRGFDASRVLTGLLT